MHLYLYIYPYIYLYIYLYLYCLYVAVLMTANFQELEHGDLMFGYMRNVVQPDMPLMVMEFWTGWFDHWAEKHHVVSNESRFCTTRFFSRCTMCHPFIALTCCPRVDCEKTF